MNESLVKYLAGLMDADGSLSFSFKKYDRAEDAFHLSLCLNLSSSLAIDGGGFIDSLPEVTGMGGLYRYGDKQQFKTWKIGKRAHLEMLLPRLIKHMVIKGKHWQWLLNKWREQRGAQVSALMREELTASSRKSRIENSGPLKPKNHPTWAWLAGYLDGDGWYRYSYQKPPQNYWMIHVGAVAHLNDIGVLNFLQNAFGGFIREHERASNVRVWVRNLGVRDASFALRFLPHLAKHSRLKRQKIEQVISHHRQRLSVPSAAVAA
jgi:hypothetical protein